MLLLLEEVALVGDEGVVPTPADAADRDLSAVLLLARLE
jgi:hypothetical protein